MHRRFRRPYLLVHRAPMQAGRARVAAFAISLRGPARPRSLGSSGSTSGPRRRRRAPGTSRPRTSGALRELTSSPSAFDRAGEPSEPGSNGIVSTPADRAAAPVPSRTPRPAPAIASGGSASGPSAPRSRTPARSSSPRSERVEERAGRQMPAHDRRARRARRPRRTSGETGRRARAPRPPPRAAGRRCGAGRP